MSAQSDDMPPGLLLAGSAGDPLALLRAGGRRLMVISGESIWVEAQALALRRQTDGDWLWMGGTRSESIATSKVRVLLGQEFRHAVFDARTGLDVEALAVLTGTLAAGSWLLLLTPPWEDWPQQPDADSVRWSEQLEAIATPHFITHFQRFLLADTDVVLWRQGCDKVVTPLDVREPWQPPSGAPTPQQQTLLSQLGTAAPGVYVVTAPRGRGKSTLAGLLAQQSPGPCWVTSPSRESAALLLQVAPASTPFWAPDALLAFCHAQTPPALDWLLIDEAAAIPTALLQALVSCFPRVLMTTTVQGYEGTGRGFLLKFCASLPHCRTFSLDEPLRWSAQDPLERVVDNALLFHDAPLPALPDEDAALRELPLQLTQEHAAEWLENPVQLGQSYALLCSAHYRTSPLDLRRLLDAPGMHFYRARRGDILCGVAWWVDEGGLSPALAHEVWAGRRRPRGNLVAQSLAAHGNDWQAPLARSRRISRIAVTAAQRRQGIGRALIAYQQTAAQDDGVDFLSVSFGYQPELWAFWQSCGFRLVRIGSHCEASSGCYSAMAVLPLSGTGESIAERAQRQLARDWPLLQRLIPLRLPLTDAVDRLQCLNNEDWRLLAGFAFAHRTMEPTFAALARLVAQTTLPLTALRLLVALPQTPEQGVADLQLSGRKALLQRWRKETAQALLQVNAEQCEQWRGWVASGNVSSK